MQVWDVNTGARTCIYTSPLGDFSRVSNLSCSRDGKLIAAAVNAEDKDGKWEHAVKLWNAQTYETMGELKVVGKTTCLTFTEDSGEIYHCSERGSICVWSTNSLELIKRMDLETDIESASFSPDFQSIITCTNGATSFSASIFDIQFGLVEEAPDISLGIVNEATISPEGRFIVSCHKESRYIHIWDAETGSAAVDPLQGHLDDVECVAFSDDGRWLVSGSKDHSVRIWDVLSNWTCGEPWLGSEGVYSVAVSPDSRLVASCSWAPWKARVCHIWEISTHMLISTLDNVLKASFFPDSRRIIAIDKHYNGYIFDALTDDLTTSFRNTYACSLVVSPDSQWLAFGSGCVYIQNMNNHMKRLLAECVDLPELRFTPDSFYLIVGESDGGIINMSMWNVESGILRATCDLFCRDALHRRIIFSPDCKRILLCDDPEESDGGGWPRDYRS